MIESEPPLAEDHVAPMRVGWFSLGLFLLSACAARAHPHIWIDALATFQFGEGRLQAVKLDWIFDKLFSAGLIADFDLDKNKQFDASEIETLRKDAFVELGSLSHFTHLWIGGEKIKIDRVENFSAMIVAGRVVYRFVLPLPQPVDPARTPVALGLYDESHYVDVVPVPEQPFRFSGIGDGACRVQAERIEGDPTVSAFGLGARRQRLICTSP